MVYPERYVTSLATVHRPRIIPVPGRVLCRVGDQVTADGVIAETELPTGYHLLDVAEVWGTPIADVLQLMVKQIGEIVEQGDVIARIGIVLKQECVSPVDGRIVDAHGSRILIEKIPQYLELKAFYPGQIARLLPGKGAVVEATGALIQGVWSSGEELRGRLEPVVADSGVSLTADRINASHMGTILVGGRSIGTEAIAQAVENQVRGVIVGSIPSDLLSAIQAAPFSVIVTEGFGDLPMDTRTFDLLCAHEGREACLNPNPGGSRQGCWPEVMIPLPADSPPPVAEYGAPLRVGARVRILRAPYENVRGQVVALSTHARKLETGMRARGATVELESVGRVFVPVENIEILH